MSLQFTSEPEPAEGEKSEPLSSIKRDSCHSDPAKRERESAFLFIPVTRPKPGKQLDLSNSHRGGIAGVDKLASLCKRSRSPWASFPRSALEPTYCNASFTDVRASRYFFCCASLSAAAVARWSWASARWYQI